MTEKKGTVFASKQSCKTQKMKHLFHILIVCFCMLLALGGSLQAQVYDVALKGYKVPYIIEGQDTIPQVDLQEVLILGGFKSKRQAKKFNKLVRDVKKVLPYAKLAGSELNRVNTLMKNLPTKKDKKDYMQAYEKALFHRFEPSLRKMTFSQGRLLIKLIDRECNKNSYELIREYRGGFEAFLWQGVATVFGANLKTDFNEDKEEDAMIERIIFLIETGQL